MKYITERLHTQWGKNKLMEAVYSLLTQHSRLSVDVTLVVDFKVHIVEKIEALNSEYKRCYPCRMSWRPNHVTIIKGELSAIDYKLFLNDYHQPDFIMKQVMGEFNKEDKLC